MAELKHVNFTVDPNWSVVVTHGTTAMAELKLEMRTVLKRAFVVTHGTTAMAELKRRCCD